MRSPIGIAIIAIFLLVGMAIVIIPATATIYSQPLDNNHTSITMQTSTAKTTASESLTIGPNPTGYEIWTPGSTSVYAISVPYINSGGITPFSQWVDVALNLTPVTKASYSGLTTWFITGEVYYNYSQYDNATNSYGAYTQVTYSAIQGSGAFGYGGTFGATKNGMEYSFPVTFNVTPQNNIDTAYGILSVNVQLNFTVQELFEGLVLASSSTYGNVHAQTYVVPGTSTLYPITNVKVNTPVTIKGQTMYGDYHLGIYSPDGTNVYNVSIGANLNPFTAQYTPTVQGKYTVVVYNSVVDVRSSIFFSAAGFLPEPTVKISGSNTGSGVYDVGESVTYTIYDTFNSTGTVNFVVGIWIGSSGEPPSSASSPGSILYFTNETPTATGTNYTYKSSFTIPSLAADNFITIQVEVTLTNSTGLYVAQNPVVTTIGVEQPIHHPPPSLLYYYLAIVVMVASGIFATYAVPADVLTKAGIMASSIASAIIIYGFGVMHLFGL